MASVDVTASAINITSAAFENFLQQQRQVEEQIEPDVAHDMQRDVKEREQTEHAPQAADARPPEDEPHGRDRECNQQKAQRPITEIARRRLDRIGPERAIGSTPGVPSERQERCGEHDRL
jgi:hypothetical protein